MAKILVFGELMWEKRDGEKEIIGGAPGNLLVRLKELGISADIVSAVGKDISGNKILNELHRKGIRTPYVQINESLGTGTSSTVTSSEGINYVRVKDNTAYDAIELTPAILAHAAKSEFVVFSSLMARGYLSKLNLERLLSEAKKSIKYYLFSYQQALSRDAVIALMAKSEILQVTVSELFAIEGLLEGHDIETIDKKHWRDRAMPSHDLHMITTAVARLRDQFALPEIFVVGKRSLAIFDSSGCTWQNYNRVELDQMGYGTLIAALNLRGMIGFQSAEERLREIESYSLTVSNQYQSLTYLR